MPIVSETIILVSSWVMQSNEKVNDVDVVSGEMWIPRSAAVQNKVVPNFP